MCCREVAFGGALSRVLVRASSARASKRTMFHIV